MKPVQFFQDHRHLLPAALLLVILPLNHNMALRMLSLFLAGGIAVWHAYKTSIPRMPLTLPFALWAGFAALSPFWSVDPLFSLSEFKTEIVYGMVAYFSFYVLTNSSQAMDKWLQAIMAGMGLTVIFAIWVNSGQLGGFQHYDWHWQHGFVAYSTYLATILPCLIFFCTKEPERRALHKLRWALLPLFLFAGYATLNRMFWLTSGVVFIAWILLWWARRKQGNHKKELLAIACGGMLTISLLFVSVAGQRPSDNVSAQSATDTISRHIINTFEHSERYDIWRFWLTRVADKPLVGIGFGRDLPHKTFAESKPMAWPDLMFAHAHNLFLDYALQLGLIGLTIFLFLIGALLRYFWRLYRHPLEEASLIGICGMTTIIAMVSKNMTDNLFWRGDALLFWALMGILVGYGRRLEEKNR